MTNRHLPVILLFAAAVRFALLAGAWNEPQRFFAPDSAEYVELAESLAADNAFARHGQPEIFRTPGYPLFLIPSWAFGAGRWQAAIVAQILLDVLLVYLTAILATMLLGRRAATWAAVFQAISAVAIVSSVQILSDGLYAMLLTLAVCLAVHHLKTSKSWSLLSAGGVLGAACYVRPVGLVMAAAFAGVLLVRHQRFRRTGAFVGIVLAILAPWVIRNFVSANYFGFSSSAGDAMYFFAAPELTARLEGADPASLRAKLKAEAQGVPAAERRRKAVKTIAEHPLRYAGLHLRGCLNTYLPGAPGVLEMIGLTRGQRGTSDVLRKEGVLAAAGHYFADNVAAIALAVPMVLLLAVKYLAAGACLVRRFRLRMSAGAWLVVIVVAVSTLLPGPFGQPRYRAPFEPLVSIAAGAGLAMVVDAIRRRRSAG